MVALVIEHMFADRRPGCRPGRDRPPAGLTSRELEVLQHVAMGRSNAEIARVLSNRVQAARFAYEHDLLEDRDAR
jgi:hypothetical protein